MKVLQKIQAATAANDDRAVFSFEFFPPKTDGGVHNLFERMRRMVAHGPAFCDITWGAGGSTADLTLEIADRMQNTVRVETMMHLTCTNAPLEKIDHALTTIKSNGIQNVLALRGDPSLGKVEGGYRFACALDLVEHIRSKHGDYFGITVAGYPEGHPDVIQDGVVSPEAYQSDLAYLKRKVDAGADVIVTQLFYDVDIFLKFVNDCRQIGITCPIVPGIMPIHNYKGFIRIADFNKSKIPPEIMAALELIKDDEEAVMAYGVHLGAEMCRKIMASGIRTIHLYTLNMEKSALAILMSLGLIEESKISRPPTNVFRVKEDIGRPMFCTPMESVNFGRPSKLEYEDKLCRFCSKELQIRVVSSAFNFQKLYYYCDHHRFVSWCHPINEEEVDHDPIEMDFKANKMKILKELKNLRNKYDDLARLIKVVLMVILINMTMSMCNSCFA